MPCGRESSGSQENPGVLVLSTFENKYSFGLDSPKIFEMTDAKARQDCIREIDLLKVRHARVRRVFELLQLQQLNHPNVITYLASFVENNEVGLPSCSYHCCVLTSRDSVKYCAGTG